MAQSIFPHLTVNDGEAALAFYEKAFGAKIEMKVPAEDKKRLMHASMTIEGGTVLLVDDFSEFGENGGLQAPTRLSGTSVTVHIEVPDADAAFERATKAGATVVMPLGNQFWGARYGKLKDPFGHVWSIGGPVK